MSHRIVASARAAAERASACPLFATAHVTGRRTAALGASTRCIDPSPPSAPRITREYATKSHRKLHSSSRWPSSIWPIATAISPASADGDGLLCTSRAPARGIGSTPNLLDDASAKPANANAEAEPKANKPAKEEAPTPAAAAADDDSDPCPPWQNPLHHNNPDYTGKVLKEDFAEGEEMPVVPLPPFEAEGDEGKVLAPPHIHELADEIVQLSMLEVKELVDRIGDHFGFEDDDGFDDEGGGGGGGGGGGDEAPAEEEKTAFELKLVGFDAKGKIKVIKEVRGMAGLGLKEAKELVEGAPTVIKKDVKKEEAEELKAKLEAVGAQVEIV